jgi:hypothetical protein
MAGYSALWDEYSLDVGNLDFISGSNYRDAPSPSEKKRRTANAFEAHCPSVDSMLGSVVETASAVQLFR